MRTLTGKYEIYKNQLSNDDSIRQKKLICYGNIFLYRSMEEMINMATTGEKPGNGTYTCDNCGQVVVLDDNTDTLPPCPKCNGTEFH